MIASAVTRKTGVRSIALAHTEGCGNSGGESERLMLRTLAGYAVHPLARRVLMLEHGCEKTHNDAFRNVLTPEQSARLEWFSIQMDGGIQPVVEKALNWFGKMAESPQTELAPIEELRVGLVTINGHANFVAAANALANLGALVVVPELFGAVRFHATIDYGEPAPSRGLHAMRTPTDDPTEIITGLGATGVELIVVWNEGAPIQSHPFIPTVEIRPQHFNTEKITARELIEFILRAASGEFPTASPAYTDFQITRGLEGVSL
jgi:altronate dehydratase